MSAKCCTKCGATKLLSEFHANGPGRYRSACKACEKDRDAQRRPARPRPPPMTRQEFLERERQRARARRAAAAAQRPPKVPKPPRVKVGRMGPAPCLLEFNGILKSRRQWAKELGLAGPKSIIAREDRMWPQDRTLTQPVVFKNEPSAPKPPHQKSDRISHRGRTQSIFAWAEELAETHRMTPDALVGRLRLGWSVERALETKVRPHASRGSKVPLIRPEFIGPKRRVGRPRKA